MTELQKIIKYLAIALAIGLAAAIIVGAVSLLGAIFDLSEGDDMILENHVEYEVAQDVTRLDIDVSAAELKIVESERLSVSSNIKDLRVSDAGGRLIIEQKQRRFSFHTTKVGEIIITIPADKGFEAIELSAGAGDVDIHSLTADRMSLEFGAGRVNIDLLSVKERMELDAGAGKLTVGGGSINDLDLDLGVGDTEIRSTLTGSCDIDCGVGKTELVICGNESDYSVRIDTGIGNASINGSTVKGSFTHGNGRNVIDIDGGVGSVNIDFEYDRP